MPRKKPRGLFQLNFYRAHLGCVHAFELLVSAALRFGFVERGQLGFGPGSDVAHEAHEGAREDDEQSNRHGRVVIHVFRARANQHVEQAFGDAHDDGRCKRSENVNTRACAPPQESQQASAEHLARVREPPNITRFFSQ